MMMTGKEYSTKEKKNLGCEMRLVKTHDNHPCPKGLTKGSGIPAGEGE